MYYKFNFTALILIIFTCCTNKISVYERFVDKNRHADFSIFEDWAIEPRDDSHSTAFFMKYTTPFISDTSDDKISLIVYAQIFNSDSNIYNMSISDVDIHRFCEKNSVKFDDFNKYIDTVFNRFLELKVSAISGKKAIYKIKLDENTKLLRYDKMQPDILIRFNSLGYEKVEENWFVKKQDYKRACKNDQYFFRKDKIKKQNNPPPVCSKSVTCCNS